MDLEEILKTFQLPKPNSFIPLAGGANNRVYKLDFQEGHTLVYKEYFLHPQDLRPRLNAEFSFLTYAWKIGIRNIPKPIAADFSLNGALYSFIPGKIATHSQLNNDLIDQKINFFQELNRHRSNGADLSKASEACFSIQDYLQITEERISRLKNQKFEAPIHGELEKFLKTSLFTKWEHVKIEICKTALQQKFSIEKVLTSEELCISPSDFGFHNALINESGNLFFIDFEYAGWDDPCKTISDLFCQPKIPIPEKFFPKISEQFASLTQNPEKCLKRLELILPVMQIKWCCILLNVFTHIGKNRRLFSESGELEKKERQLMLAKEQFAKIQR